MTKKKVYIITEGDKRAKKKKKKEKKKWRK